MLGLKEYKLSQLLNETLGSGKIKKTEWIHHSCPFCNHHKPKLQVSLTEHVWHCWVCGSKGRNLYSLFKKANAYGAIDKLKELYPDRVKKAENVESAMNLFGIKDESFKTPPVELPPSFIPLWGKEKSIIKNSALSYLCSRGVTMEDIVKHNIGYCENQFDYEYNNKIIVPSYDADGVLNFFAGRSFIVDEKFPHKLPAVPKDNIIGFELFINWSEPLVICEGAMDALAIKRNCVPLFGKIMSKKLILNIVENGIKHLYLALDKDALKTTLKISKQLEGFGVAVSIPQFYDKDPSAIGFKKVEQILDSTKPLDFSSFISMKLSGK